MPLLSGPILAQGLKSAAASRGLLGGTATRLGSTYNVLHEFLTTAANAVTADVAAAFTGGSWVQGTPGFDTPFATGVSSIVFTPANFVALSNRARPSIAASAAAAAAANAWAGTFATALPASIGEGVLNAQAQANTGLVLTGDTAAFASLLPKYVFPASFNATLLAPKIQSAWTANPLTASDQPALQANFARAVATLLVSTITSYALVGTSTSPSPTPPPPPGSPLLIVPVYS